MSTEDELPLEPGSEQIPESAAELPALPVVEVIQVVCWRCGLLTVEAVSCSHCFALLKKENAQSLKRQDAQKHPRLLSMLLAYLIFLLTSLIYSIILHGSKNLKEADYDTGILVVEVIDLLITLSLFVFLGRRIVRRPSLRTRLLTWCIAPFISVGVFYLSHWYVEMLRRHFSLDWLYVQKHMEMTFFDVMVVCVQPAIVEELFFRYFAYGTLRQVTNAHSAIVLSALMFALAHLYNPLGLPFLFCMGIMLGYARVYSGGLLLPMLMHFGHNFAVLYLESLK